MPQLHGTYHNSHEENCSFSSVTLFIVAPPLDYIFH